MTLQEAKDQIARKHFGDKCPSYVNSEFYNEVAELYKDYHCRTLADRLAEHFNKIKIDYARAKWDEALDLAKHEFGQSYYPRTKPEFKP